VAVSSESRLNVVPPATPEKDNKGRVGAAIKRGLSPRKIGAVYILILICIVFSFWASNLFPRTQTIRDVVDGNSIALLAALTLILPLSAGVFDLSEAATMSLSGIVTAYMVTTYSLPLWLAIVIAVGVSVLVGLANVLVVVVMKIDSFIGTLATSSLIAALITLICNGNTINSNVLTGGFSKIAQGKFLGFILPAWYALILAFVIWYLYEHTAAGRRLYATGFNKRAARLAGVRTDFLQAVTLVAGAVLAGLVGVVLASSIGAGSPTVGTPYLLSSFAAVFLGATQIKEGRFNAWGTVIAVILLGTGVTGLGLANAPSWTGQAFTGVVLIASLAVTGLQRRKVGVGSGREDSAVEHAESSEIAVVKETA
jgi:ribose transport system permease protein